MKANIGLYIHQRVEVDYPDEPGLIEFVASESGIGYLHDEDAYVSVEARYEFGGESVLLRCDVRQSGAVEYIAKGGSLEEQAYGPEEWETLTVGDRTLAEWIDGVRAFVEENFGDFYARMAEEDA